MFWSLDLQSCCSSLALVLTILLWAVDSIVFSDSSFLFKSSSETIDSTHLFTRSVLDLISTLQTKLSKPIIDCDTKASRLKSCWGPKKTKKQSLAQICSDTPRFINLHQKFESLPRPPCKTHRGTIFNFSPPHWGLVSGIYRTIMSLNSNTQVPKAARKEKWEWSTQTTVGKLS